MASLSSSLFLPCGSHRSTLFFSKSTTAHRRAPPSVTASLNLPAAAERLASATVYILPFFNSLHYGHYLFGRYPSLTRAIAPVAPLYSAYRSVPYAPFIAFFAIYLGVVRNPRFPHGVRFNAMQSLVLDVCLSAPLLLARILPLGRGLFWSRMAILGHSAVFVSMAVFFVYCFSSCLIDHRPEIPFVSDAASRQV